MKRCLTLTIIFACLLLPTPILAGRNSENSHKLNKNLEPPVYRNRCIVLYPMALPFLFMINADKGIVGYPGFGIKATPYSCGELILKRVPDFTEKVKDVGYPMAPNIETIIGLRPEFVIIPTFSEALEMRLRHLHFSVLPFSGGFGNISALLKSVRALGQATGHTMEAENYITYYKGILSNIEKRVAGTKNRPTVLYLSQEGPHGNKLTSGGRFDTLIHNIIKVAGGISLSRKIPGNFGLISEEDILKWNPEYIIVGPGSGVETIYHSNILRFVRAVRNRKVFQVPFNGLKYSSWYAPAQSSLGLLWTVKLLHPETFKRLKIKEAAAYYYKTFWHISVNSLKIKGSLF